MTALKLIQGGAVAAPARSAIESETVAELLTELEGCAEGVPGRVAASAAACIRQLLQSHNQTATALAESAFMLEQALEQLMNLKKRVGLLRACAAEL